MADNKKVFIVLGLLSIVMIPLIKAKPEVPIELRGEIISTEFERANLR